MKACVVVEVKLQIFLISTMNGAKYSTSPSGPFILDEKTTGTH
jgi:hypothetical protein